MIRGTGTFESLDTARKFFSGDLYASEIGIRIDELNDGNAVCSFEITEHHRPTVAQQVSVTYLNQPKGKKLIARAECRKDGRNSCVYLVNVVDETGREIATALMTGFKLQRQSE